MRSSRTRPAASSRRRPGSTRSSPPSTAVIRPGASGSDATAPDRPARIERQRPPAVTDQTPFDLELAASDDEAAQPGITRHVAVAIDAAGAGGARRYTYAVPANLADVVD